MKLPAAAHVGEFLSCRAAYRAALAQRYWKQLSALGEGRGGRGWWMLEINHVNLPRPHENAQFHICGRSFSFALPAVHCRTRYVGRDGVLYLTGCHPKTSGTNGVLLNNPRSLNSPWYRWLGIQSINPSSPTTGHDSCCEMVDRNIGHRKSGQFVGLFVSLLRPFARGQQAGGFNLAITSLQRRRKFPGPRPVCLSACLPARSPARRALWKLQPKAKGSNRRHSRSLTRGSLR